MTILGIVVGITLGFGGGYFIAKARQVVKNAEVAAEDTLLKERLRLKGLVR